jgi:uncharacterized protein YndB with AHSA1/START domain
LEGQEGEDVEANDEDAAAVIELTIFIAAPAEIVFDFLLKPELLARWIGRSRAHDPKPGDPFGLEFVGNDYVARGTYREITPPRRLAFTWGWEGRDDFPPGISLVEIELEPQNGGTVLRLRHSGLPKDPSDDLSGVNHQERWQRYLSRLRIESLRKEHLNL